MQKGYAKSLANEWMAWVEDPTIRGTREREIYTLIRNWLAKTKPKILADIGCGQGSCSKLINKKISYIGIDPSTVLIRRARQLYSSLNKEFQKGDAYNTPLNNNSVNAVLSVWVWSHLENLRLAAKEMFRILKSKGRFLIITANPETYKERKTFYKEYAIKDNLLTGTFNLGEGKFLTNTPLYLHSKKEIEEAITRAGLTINYIKRLGRAESSNKGLYLAIEGAK